METSVTAEKKQTQSFRYKEDDLKYPIYGLSKEQLGKENIEAILNGNKSNAVSVRIKDKQTDQVKSAIARISLVKKGNELKIWLDYKNEKPLVIHDMISGISISDSERKLLLEGKAIYKEGFVNDSGKIYNSWLVIDKDLNKLAFIRDKKMQAPSMLKGVELNPEQQEKWKNGEAIFLKGMKRADNEKGMAATIQYNPITGIVSWSFPTMKPGVSVQKEEKTQTLKDGQEIKTPETNLTKDINDVTNNGEGKEKLNSTNNIPVEVAPTIKNKKPKNNVKSEDEPKSKNKKSLKV